MSSVYLVDVEVAWEVGLSVKHNHDAAKHSRLSHRLDFGKEWFGSPCSRNTGTQ